jgi:molecular chaperone DnaK
LSAVGIDLGTTFSVAAVADDAGISIVPNADSSRITPSVVHIKPDGPPVVGAQAQRAARVEPDDVIAHFKRDMGTTASYRVGATNWTPAQLSGAVLGQLKADVEEHLKGRIDRAVVTIPAYFGDDARLATQEAGQLAGLEITQLVHEPTAAALAFGMGPNSGDRTVLVYDLGGGTFDVSVVRFRAELTEVIATAGDHRLGGKDWDDVIIALASDQFINQHGVDPADDDLALADLRERAEQAKRTLSRMDRATFPLVCNGATARLEITREEFERQSASLLERTERLVAQVLSDVGGREVIDGVILVGGSTRMPACERLVRKVTESIPLRGVDPDIAVAAGAALLALSLETSRSDVATGGGTAALGRIRDVTAHALGFVVISADGHRFVNEVMIPRNAPIPATATKTQQIQTTERGPNTLEIHLLQGDRERPLETSPLGLWRFADIPHQPSGSANVEISFAYDHDGVVQAGASIDGRPLATPEFDREDRDISWSDDDPTQPAASPGLAVILVIDCSGSMAGPRLAQAQDACRAFIAELSESASIGLVSFATEAKRIAPLNSPTDRLEQAVQSLTAGGATDMAAGLEAARALLGEVPGDQRRVIVLLTDGEPKDVEQALKAASAVQRDGMDIAPRGVDGADESLLRRIATIEGDFMTTGEGLVSSFRAIARQLAPTTSGTGLGAGHG